MKMSFILATSLTLALFACTGNSQNNAQNTPTPAESTNPLSAMATAAAGAAHAVGKTAQGAAGAVAGGVAQMTPHTQSYAMTAQNGSGEHGKVTLVGTGSKTAVTISLSGEDTTGKQPAHIHAGPCATLGGVKYPLSDVVLDKSVTVVDAPLATLTNGTFAINVHESAANLAKYVACGDLTKANMTK
jgi:hypothetical protein